MTTPSNEWKPVPFIEAADKVHLRTRVHLDTRKMAATEYRPVHKGAWFMTVTDLDGEPIWSGDMAVNHDQVSEWRPAIVKDSFKRHLCIPAVAAYHPALEITGLSYLSGGWLAGIPRRYEQPLFPGCFPQVRALSEKRLERYMDAGQIALAGLPPKDTFEVDALPWERVEAMLLGVAIGDALCFGTEGPIPKHRVLDTITGPGITDDTQMTVRTLRSLMRLGRLDLQDLQRTWSGTHIKGIGGTVLKAFRRQEECIAAGKDPWHGRITTKAEGNGAVMRVPGVLALHALCHPPSLLADLLLSSALTHDGVVSNASCTGWAAVLLNLGREKSTIHSAQDVFQCFLAAAGPVEGTHVRLHCRTPHHRRQFEGTLCRFIQEQVIPAHENGAPVRKLRNTWYSGAYLLETMPTALSIVAEYLDEPERAILEAANFTWDNDTIASMVAAAMGARHGKQAFAGQWITALREYRQEQGMDSMIAVIRELAKHYGPLP